MSGKRPGRPVIILDVDQDEADALAVSPRKGLMKESFFFSRLFSRAKETRVSSLNNRGHY